MLPEVCIWDWNGTLLDDAQVCVDVMNGMLEKRGLPRLDMGRYREVFTFPVEEYYKAVGFDFAVEPFSLLAQEYILPYNRAALGCGLCPGARQALDWLRGQGVRQVVVSASHQGALEEQVEALGIGEFFEAVLGVRDVLGAGKAGIARGYLDSAGVSPGQAWCVGDTLHDYEVALEMGCRCVLVAQGHQSVGRLRQAGGAVLRELGELPGFFMGKF